MNSIIDKLLNLPNMEVKNYEIGKKSVTLKIDFTGDISICPHCNHETNYINQKRNLTVRDLPILGKQTVLEIERCQYYCQDCKRYFTEEIDNIDFDRHSTNRYQEYIYECVKKSTITQTAKDEDLTYDRVKSIFDKQFNQKKYHSSPDESVLMSSVTGKDTERMRQLSVT